MRPTNWIFITALVLIAWGLPPMGRIILGIAVYAWGEYLSFKYE